MTIVTVLLLVVLALVIASAVGKCPLWVAVCLLTLLMLVGHLTL